MIEMEEERLRMREHVMNEVCACSHPHSASILSKWCVWVISQSVARLSNSQVDTNKDRLVSLEEFLVATRKKEFLEPDSWEVM